MSAFGDRLRIAFNGAKNAEIARKLGITDTAVKNYMVDRIPPAEVLIQIKNLTNVQIDWLLTGEQNVQSETKSQVETRTQFDFEQIFSEKIREIVREEISKNSKPEVREPAPEIIEVHGLHFDSGRGESAEIEDEDPVERDKFLKSVIEKHDRIELLPLAKGAKTFEDERK